MDLGLSGRTALVTGSSAGVGAAIVEHLAAEGCRVVVHGRRARTAAAQAERIVERGGAATAVHCDLADPEATARMLDVARTGGPIDILVANAGPFAEHTFDAATDEDWLGSFQGNVMSAVRCIRPLLPEMRERGWGRVITVSTRGAVTPLPNMTDYSAAKAAVVNLTANLAQQLVGTGVTANTISPGVILTPGMRAMFRRRAVAAGDHRPWEDLEAEVVADYAANPVGRLGRPEDVAAAAVFLASPRADYVTGVTLRVDGGITGTINP